MAKTTRTRVPMRSTRAEKIVVALSPSDAGGAKEFASFSYFYCSTTVSEESLKVAKQYCISKNVVMDAWRKVKSNSRSEGID